MAKWLSSILSAPLDSSDSTTPSKADPGLSASEMGFAVAAGGGSIADATPLQYVLSCVVPPGETPTPDQIGRAVGILGGSVSEAAVIEALKKRE